MSKRHIAIWSVGDFLPGQIVTGISPERLAELVAMGAVQVVEEADAGGSEEDKPASSPAAKPASRRTTATGD